MAVGKVRTPTDLRLAELMAAISLATDLGSGYPLERGLRDALLAVGLARELGLDGRDLSDVYYTALLQHLGCTAGAHELAALVGGDDIATLHVAMTGDQRLVSKAIVDLARRKPLNAAAVLSRRPR